MCARDVTVVVATNPTSLQSDTASQSTLQERAAGTAQADSEEDALLDEALLRQSQGDGDGDEAASNDFYAENADVLAGFLLSDGANVPESGGGDRTNKQL